MKVSANQYAQALWAALNECRTDDQRRAVADRFAAEIKERNDLKLRPEIEKDFRRIDFLADGEIEALVESARPLSKSDLERLKEGLKKETDLKIVWRETINPKVVAGAKVYVGDDIYDYSLADGLKQLREAIIKN